MKNYDSVTTVKFRDELYYGQELNYPIIKEGDTDLPTALNAFDCNCVLECLYPKLFGFDKLVVSVLSADNCCIYAGKIVFNAPKGWIVNGNPMCESLMPIKGRISKLGMVNYLEDFILPEAEMYDTHVVSSFQLRLWRVRANSAPIISHLDGILYDNDPILLKHLDYVWDLEFREEVRSGGMFTAARSVDVDDIEDDFDIEPF